MGRWLVSPVRSTVFQKVFIHQILPLIDNWGELLFPVIQLVLVGDPSLRTCKLRSYIHSSSSLPLASCGWIWSTKWECPLRSPMMIELSVGFIIDASNLVTWVCVWKGEIVKMEPLAFLCLYAYRVNFKASLFSGQEFFWRSCCFGWKAAIKFFLVLANDSKTFDERSFVVF